MPRNYNTANFLANFPPRVNGSPPSLRVRNLLSIRHGATIRFNQAKYRGGHHLVLITYFRRSLRIVRSRPHKRAYWNWMTGVSGISRHHCNEIDRRLRLITPFRNRLKEPPSRDISPRGKLVSKSIGTNSSLPSSNSYLNFLPFRFKFLKMGCSCLVFVSSSFSSGAGGKVLCFERCAFNRSSDLGLYFRTIFEDSWKIGKRSRSRRK